MNTGKKFEADIKQACIEQDVDYTRMKDAGWTGEQTTRRFTSRNICDAILFYEGALLFAEIKHRQKSLTFKSITQYNELIKKWNPEKNIFSGVIAKLDGRVFFVSTPTITLMIEQLGKKSFNATDASEYGMEIAQVVPKGKKNPRPVIWELINRLASWKAR